MVIVSNMKGLINNAEGCNVRAIAANYSSGHTHPTSPAWRLPSLLVSRMAQVNYQQVIHWEGSTIAIVRWDPFRELEEMSDRLRPGWLHGRAQAQALLQGKSEVMTVTCRSEANGRHQRDEAPNEP